MIKFDLNEALTAKIEQALQTSSPKLTKALELAFFSIGQDMATESRKLAPYKTGNLRGSITVETDGKKARVGTNLVYARIHDVGGSIKGYTVRPKRGKVLRFQSGGKTVFARSAKIPPRRMQPYKGRGYLTPAFKRMKNGEARSILAHFLDTIL
jgi:phage gpG-like protein